MSPAEDHRLRHARVKEILFEVLRLPLNGRSGYLATACAGDEELRREVESLLEYDDGLLGAGDEEGPLDGPRTKPGS
jgi:hypothetical protein